MKAVVQHTYGSADVLELREIEVPVVHDDEVLVRVRAASVNALDWHVMRGRPFFIRLVSGLRRPRNGVRGIDVAGHVEGVGRSVTSFQPGDAVFGWCQGSFAEYASAGERNLLPKPDRLTHEEAAAVPVAALTALQGLRDLGRVRSGQRVLVIGASGGVGTFAVQLANSFGAEVTGVCSTRNRDMVRSLGADHVVDYTRHDVTQGEQRFDLVFQLAGTASPLSLRHVLTREGTLVLSSGMGRLAGIDRIVKAVVSSPFVSQRLVTWVANENREDLEFIAGSIEAGELTPVVDRSYPLSQAPEAIRYVEAGHTRGKVVITV